MDIGELRTKSVNELREMLFELREKLRQLRFDLAAGKVKNVREIRQKKKDVARILTLLNQKSSSRTKTTFGAGQATKNQNAK